MTVWSLGTLLYVLLLGDIPYETTDHIIHNKPKKVFFDPYWQIMETKSKKNFNSTGRNSWKQNPLKILTRIDQHGFCFRETLSKDSLDYHPKWLWILFPENFHDDVTGDEKSVLDFVPRNHFGWFTRNIANKC